MIRWAERGDDDMPDPEEVKGGYFRAGIRCLEAIRALQGGATIPVIIHSAQNEEQIRSKLREQNIVDDHLAVVNKRGDFTKFFEAIRGQVPKIL
jgi:CheY-like chemotaxis protein